MVNLPAVEVEFLGQAEGMARGILRPNSKSVLPATKECEIDKQLFVVDHLTLSRNAVDY